jgi:GPH family glycoside/pentoside/hexuronide:cation symporter
MRKRLGPGDYLSYGVGNTGLAIVNIVSQTWLMFFLAPSEGRVLVPATVVGAIWLAGRVIDSIIDPIVSNWSDRTRGRRGRRVPFLLAGAIPLAALFFILFCEPIYAGSLVLRSAILALGLNGFYFFFSLYAAPYNALVPDLASDRESRINLSTSSAAFNLVGTSMAMILPGILFSAFSTKGGAFDGAAYMPAIGILAVAAALSLGLSALLLARRSGPVEDGATPPFLASVRMILGNKPFVAYLIAMNVFWAGFTMINVSVPYYVTVLMGKPASFTSIAMGLAMGMAVLFFPVANALGKRIGSKRTVMISAGVMGLALFLVPFIKSPPFGLPPEAFGLAVMCLAGAPLAGLFIIPNAMVAELSDYRAPDGTKPGEAIYYGVQGFIQKIAIGIVTLLAGLLFDNLGKSAERPLGVMLSGPLGGLFAAAAFVVFLFAYPDDRKGLGFDGDSSR